MNVTDTDIISTAGNQCDRPPHFPPHCGCPAGFHLDDES